MGGRDSSSLTFKLSLPDLAARIYVIFLKSMSSFWAHSFEISICITQIQLAFAKDLLELVGFLATGLCTVQLLRKMEARAGQGMV